MHTLRYVCIMYVCAYVRMYVCTYVRMCAYLVGRYGHLYACLPVLECVRISACLGVCLYGRGEGRKVVGQEGTNVGR